MNKYYNVLFLSPVYSTIYYMLVDVPAQGFSVSVEISVISLWEVELSALATLSISTGRRLPVVASIQSPLMRALFATATHTREPLSSAISTALLIMISGEV